MLHHKKILMAVRFSVGLVTFARRDGLLGGTHCWDEGGCIYGGDGVTIAKTFLLPGCLGTP
jgi:hypothetical protein